MAKKQSNNHKNLQEQIRKLKNEIEELKTEREEAKKSVVFFMHEADVAQKELEKMKQVIAQEPFKEEEELAKKEKEQESVELLKISLEQTSLVNKQWQEKYDDLYSVHMSFEDQRVELEIAKTREINLRSMNKILRNEVRKMSKVQEEALNIDYLRNVVINFLEKKSARLQLVPVLSTLLQCTYEDQTKLHQLVQNNSITTYHY
ncbi:hypothetical protein BY458DRAFT_37176 [Sporodiniella umbellata]|nr:hypothetical protein BY458DRAFT_37176 [Sporodiniella umbellata]